ncbi:MAG: hypothetical protein O3C43_18195 [Verrucomicrobia bacterium]|nr:hypothetical protein [Verrucomicrobiota bacterium]MDA1068421.1 hypothetical protein [Verrucomicrobiota bacterium]
MKKILGYTSIVFILAGFVSSASAQSRMDRLSWTDRSVSNPPLVHSSSIASTINQFWNVTLAEEAVRTPKPTVTYSTPGCSPVRTNPGTEVVQDRSTRERRGYFGINLFNAIPIIDFVHGNVTSSSKDRVEGRR